MRLGRAIGGVICHHRVAHALSAKGPKAEWRGGGLEGSPSHTTWRDNVLGMQLPRSRLSPLSCQPGHTCVRDLWWPVVCLTLLCYMRISAAPKMKIYSRNTLFPLTKHILDPPLSLSPLCKHPSHAVLSNNTCTAMFLWYVLSRQRT